MQANIKAFEKELKCPICCEYVDDAVAPPCQHLFCRKCIVHAIERKSTCPVCGAAIQRGLRSLEAQPWTNDVINEYRHTLQEIFRDRETDFLFSQVPTTGFASFKPPEPSPNRTRFMPAQFEWLVRPLNDALCPRSCKDEDCLLYLSDSVTPARQKEPSKQGRFVRSATVDGVSYHGNVCAHSPLKPAPATPTLILHYSCSLSFFKRPSFFFNI